MVERVTKADRSLGQDFQQEPHLFHIEQILGQPPHRVEVVLVVRCLVTTPPDGRTPDGRTPDGRTTVSVVVVAVWSVRTPLISVVSRVVLDVAGSGI
jgi:hypothetical protein